MFYRVSSNFFGRTLSFVTNSKYIADFMVLELKNSSVVTDASLTSNDHAYIEKVIVNAQIGQAIVPEQTLEGTINYYGRNIPYLQITTFDNMQPIRVFLNSVASKFLNDICIPIHASTVLSKKGVIAFMGDKNSGKTTLTISNVLWKDCSLVSDDITFVGTDSKGRVICDGLFNGVHVFEGEKYIYKNKLFMGEHEPHEFIKNRMTFKNEYVTQEPCVLRMLILPTIREEGAHKTIQITK